MFSQTWKLTCCGGFHSIHIAISFDLSSVLITFVFGKNILIKDLFKQKLLSQIEN